MKQTNILILFLLTSFFTNAQDIKAISGIEKFLPSDRNCFNQLNWSLNYKNDCSDTEVGTFQVIFSDAKFSREGAKLMYKGKEYSPTDAGLSAWPEEYSKYIEMRFKLVVKHGETVLSEQEISVMNGSGKRVRVGLYRDGLFHTTGDNQKKLPGINYKNCTISISNITSEGCYQGALPLIDLLKARNKID